MYGAMFGYIAGTPFVYIHFFGISPGQYGVLFGINIAGTMAASWLSSRLALRVGLDRALQLGGGLALISAIGLIVCALTGLGSIVGIAACLFAFLFGNTIVAANAMAGAISACPALAGSAAGVAGLFQCLAAGAASWLIGRFSDGGSLPMAAVILAGVLVSAAFNVLATRRGSRAMPEPARSGVAPRFVRSPELPSDRRAPGSSTCPSPRAPGR
jgi:DHA1 family bicyclomycin/chloramphenicol resistance-like MFS transporter